VRCPFHFPSPVHHLPSPFHNNFCRPLAGGAGFFPPFLPPIIAHELRAPQMNKSRLLVSSHQL
jgi:hypothetical protein